jgi:DNA-binding NarL/FixJ family response regulator
MPSAQPIGLLVTADLMTSSKLQAAAERQGVKLVLAPSIEVASGLDTAQQRPAVVLVDLSFSESGSAGDIEQLRRVAAEGAQLIAFGPHVHRERLERARSAGYDLVLTRGQIHAELETLLPSLLGEAGE